MRTDFGASIRLLRSFSLLCNLSFPQCAQSLGRKEAFHAPASIPKPVRGLDHEAYENFPSYDQSSF